MYVLCYIHSQLLKALALDAHKAAQGRKVAEEEVQKQKQEAPASAKACCTIA